MDADLLESISSVPAGTDCRGENTLKVWGMIPLCNKVLSRDTGGALYVFQHPNMGKGGPPRHVHFNQDEWFYVLAGEFAMEIGEQKLRLRPGDSILAPRRIPHAWAHLGERGGTLMTAVTPAGTFEEFIMATTRQSSLPSWPEMERAFAAHDMQVLGPPLQV